LRDRHFDDDKPDHEKLPRKFRVAFFDPTPKDRPRKIIIALPTDNNEWIQIGDRIDDNADRNDGYRFHDVLHFSNAAHLGWSPVIRALLRRKRKSDPDADRIQDGARAVSIEEALIAFIFAHAERRDFFRETKNVDFGLLKTVERITMGLEVRHRSYDEWEFAILDGYRLFRELQERGEGLLVVDLTAAKANKLQLVALPDSVKRSIGEGQ
jgi:hypothetical protein